MVVIRKTTAQRSSRLPPTRDRKSTRLNSSHGYISYAVFCLKKKKNSLRSNAPHIESLHDHGLQYILYVKEVYHATLFTQPLQADRSVHVPASDLHARSADV